MPIDVSIIVVNWNSGTLLRYCMDSIAAQQATKTVSIEVVVVDNGSVDRSLELPNYPFKLIILHNERNHGFARACNEGAAKATGSFILFFNPDCMLRAGSMEVTIATLRQSPSIGVVGVALSDDGGQIARSCHHFPSLRHFVGRITGLARLFPAIFESAMRNWPHDEDRDVDHVIGAFYMIRAELFRTLGGFDERFFVYLEDLDLSLRVRRAGYRVRFIAQPSSYHKGGGTSEKAKAVRLFYATRSRILYAFKHFSHGAAWGHLVATLVIEPFCRTVELVLRRRVEEISEVVQAFGMVLRDLPLTLRRTRQL